MQTEFYMRLMGACTALIRATVTINQKIMLRVHTTAREPSQISGGGGGPRRAPIFMTDRMGREVPGGGREIPRLNINSPEDMNFPLHQGVAESMERSWRNGFWLWQLCSSCLAGYGGRLLFGPEGEILGLFPV